MSKDITFVDTLSGINVGNGVVKLYFVTQDENEGQPEFPKAMQPAQTLVMPVPGFMYMVSVVKGLLENPKMIEQIQRYIDAGLLPASVKQDNASVSPGTREIDTTPTLS